MILATITHAQRILDLQTAWTCLIITVAVLFIITVSDGLKSLLVIFPFGWRGVYVTGLAVAAGCIWLMAVG